MTRSPLHGLLLLGFLLLGLLLCGCLGRPVVGDLPPPSPSSCVQPEFDCNSFVSANPPAAIDDSVFAPGFQSSCGSPEVLPGCGNVTGSGNLISVRTRDCASPAPVVIDRNLVLRGMDFSCSSVSFSLAENVTLTLVDSLLVGANFQVEGQAGSTLEVRESTGQEAHFRVSGAAWLDVAHSEFVNLRIDLAADSIGRSATVVESSIEGLFVRGGPRATLLLARNGVFDAELQVGDLRVESSSVFGLQVEAERTTFSGGRIEQGNFRGSDFSFIGAQLEDVTVDECDTARLSSALVIKTQLAACTNGTTLTDTNFDEGVLSGAVTVQGGSVSQSGFLATRADELNFRRTAVAVSAICGNPALNADVAHFACVSCDPEISEPNLKSSIVRAPACPSLEAAASSQ